MQIKPHQSAHIAEQQRRFRQAISDCQFETYTFVGYYTSKINDFERDCSRAIYKIRPIGYIKVKNGKLVFERVN